ncbi:Gp19/Gp15/Gp42 family protein [uncultured Rothia sp.]|uniref:Gp19/Gp15/Gp42 family protein n=1 Tax=uncultured Rothia sp. TaxID=316088 RepID=UPI00262DF9BA|nr:Gp19/Gp15/Gp42 family protein [uncultured Rothia sp.]
MSERLTIASVEDVKSALRRDFRGDEESHVSSLLEKAENLIRVRYRRLDELALDEVVFDLVRNIEAEAVARVLRADDGGIYRSETEDGYSYQLNYLVASGLLDILEKDWKNLAQATGTGRFRTVALASDGYAAARSSGRVAAGPWQFQYGWPAQDSFSCRRYL